MAKFIIAAISARSFAQAAVANGHQVVALDAFADADLQAVCAQTIQLKFNENAVDVANFKRIFTQINLAEIDGFLYGSLFDDCPDLLAWVADKIRLVGNAPDVMRIAKSFAFFKLLDDLQIAHPEVRLQAPKLHECWLAKQFGGSGGTHIKPAKQWENGDYYQKKMAGISVSMLFVADGKTARTIGFHRQFVAPTAEMPYRFAGAVSNIALQPNIHADFEHAAQQLTSALNLRGLNNLDAILNEDGLWILELNPRLSASFDLYENIFNQHLSGCAGDLTKFSLQKNSAKAQLILYADEVLEIPIKFAWPSWVADIPHAESAKIAQNAPICSVYAEAKTAELAENLVRKRAKKLMEMLKNDAK